MNLNIRNVHSAYVCLCVCVGSNGTAVEERDCLRSVKDDKQ